jgi:hypothetical protein
MVMRLDLEFPRPLMHADKLRVLLAAATLAKCQRVRFARGDYAAVVFGEALSMRRLGEALAEQGLAAASMSSSLDEDEDKRADDPSGEERVRAIGR